MWDLDRIKETEDRSCSEALLARLEEPEVEDTLRRLDDPRVRPALFAIHASVTESAVRRRAAGSLLRSGTEGVSREMARRWWDSEDPLPRRSALLAFDLRDADIVTQVASDAAHPQHEAAIATMQYGFEAPRFQALKIAALDHADPVVRATAADTVWWDEPIAAEEALLRHVEDPEPAVVCAVVTTLPYYPTRRCVARLKQVRRRGPKQVRETIRDVLLELSAKMRVQEPFERGPRPGAAPLRLVRTCAEVLDDYADLGGEWAAKKERFGRTAWEAFGETDRRRLAAFFLAHPDAWLRDAAARVFAEWDDHASLLALREDPSFLVRKSATWCLGRTSRDPRAEAALSRAVADPTLWGAHATETIGAWMAHVAKPPIDPLVQLARDEREPVQLAAIAALVGLRARGAVESLLPLLEEPPNMTWAVHIALLEACRTLGLEPRGLEQLRTVDHWWLEQAIRGQ